MQRMSSIEKTDLPIWYCHQYINQQVHLIKIQ